MKTKFYVYAFSIFILLNTACSTIYFHHAGIQNDSIDQEEWHHTGVFGFIEFSDAVDMNVRCNSTNWGTIMTQQTFVEGLVSAVTFNLYTPQNASYSCIKIAKPTPITTNKLPAKEKVRRKKKKSVN